IPWGTAFQFLSFAGNVAHRMSLHCLNQKVGNPGSQNKARTDHGADDLGCRDKERNDGFKKCRLVGEARGVLTVFLGISSRTVSGRL
ncbi:hypothetical protein PISMIDRAFT_685095, partial [Pisolithus microcarpus 441]